MTSRLSCRKYRSLRLTAQDFELSPRQTEFLAAHCDFCAECRRYDQQVNAIIVALQSANLDHQGTQAFSMRVLWAVSLEKAKVIRGSLRPVALGAVTAACAL